MKVVIDTNVVMDAIHGGVNNCLKVFDYVATNKITPITSRALEKEYNVISTKIILDKLKDKLLDGTLKENDFETSKDLIYQYQTQVNKLLIGKCEIHESVSQRKLSPDPDDNKLINLAIDSNSLAIITKNVQDFRCVEQQNIQNAGGSKILILTPKQFVAYYNERTHEIVKNQERLDTVNLYLKEFPAAKKLTYDDCKVIRDFNNNHGRPLAYKEIREIYNTYSVKIREMESKIDDIQSKLSKLEQASKLIPLYEEKEKKLEKLNGAILSKLIGNKNEVVHELRGIKEEMSCLGISGPDDYKMQIKTLEKDKQLLPELKKNLNMSKDIVNQINLVLEVFNKALVLEVGREISVTRDITRDR